MITTAGSLITTADDNAQPFERRFPENDRIYETIVDVDAYSPEQEQQIGRILPIKFCTYPEFYLNEAIDTYIPQDYQENKESYDVRKTRAMSCFEPFYSHLVDLIVGTALRKGVITPQEAPPEWDAFFKNVDLQGHSITSFAKTLFTEALNGGVAGLWSEYPVMPAGITAAEEKRINPRPYFTIIKVDNILDCRIETGPVSIGGETTYEIKVKYLRIKSEKRIPSPKNEHFEIVVPTVVVYDIIQLENEDGIPEDRVRCRTYVKNLDVSASNEYILNEVSYLSIGFIPFSPCYGGKEEDFCRARPLLYDIARLNLHHWAVCADLSENIHINSSPMLTGTGIRPDEEIFSGSGRSLMSQNPDAKFGMLSPGMDGAQTTHDELARIEAAMYKLAAVAMTPGKTQVESGFAKLLDRSQSDSQLAVLVGSLEDCLNRALLYASAYRAYPRIEVTVSKNFIPVKLHSQQVMSLSQLYKDANAFPIGTFLEMLEAGEMFEGLANFTVKGLLEKMGLTGNETARELGIGSASSLSPNPPATNNIQNTMEEATGMSLNGENSEVTVEMPEA